MASSVDRSTVQEKELALCFIAVFARVYYASNRLSQDAIYVFAQLLDMDGHDLINFATNREEFNHELKETYNLTRIGRVRSAARYIHQMAWTLLKNYGREEEAAECFRLADWFHQAGCTM